jgi:hypothetical protein
MEKHPPVKPGVTIWSVVAPLPGGIKANHIIAVGVVLLVLIASVMSGVYLLEIRGQRIEQAEKDKRAAANIAFKKQWSDFFYQRDSDRHSMDLQFEAKEAGMGGFNLARLQIEHEHCDSSWDIATTAYEKYARGGWTLQEALKQIPEKPIEHPPE